MREWGIFQELRTDSCPPVTILLSIIKLQAIQNPRELYFRLQLYTSEPHGYNPPIAELVFTLKTNWIPKFRALNSFPLMKVLYLSSQTSLPPHPQTPTHTHFSQQCFNNNTQLETSFLNIFCTHCPTPFGLAFNGILIYSSKLYFRWGYPKFPLLFISCSHVWPHV